MADIKTITELRERSGAGMMDCKKALEEANNDIEAALEILRKKGEAKAAKKAERATSEGLIAIKEDENKLALVAIACETDFVSRNQDFIDAVQNYADKLFEMGEEAFKSWAEEDIKKELVIKIGENIKLVAAKIYQKAGKNVGQYIHSNKKIAAVVVMNGGEAELARDIAMHATAMSPEYLAPEDVPAEVIEKEKEIYREQLKQEDKSEEIIEKILQGKINKFYEENCLLKQEFIKDDKKKVEQLLPDGVKIVSFDLYKI